MISMLRKEACSGSIHDLAHIPTQNCLADCLTKAAKADNLITAVTTGKLPDVDIHHTHGTLMEHNTFLSTWCRTFMHTMEKDVFFVYALKVYLSHQLHEKNHSMWCLWEINILKNHRNKRCAIGTTCHWALLCQLDLPRGVIAIRSCLSLMFRHRRKRLKMKVKMLRK